MVVNNLLSVIYSIIFVFLTIGISIFFYKVFKISTESMRKLIHITVSNWCFILIYGFDSLAYAIAGPICFIILNTIFVYGGFGKYLGMGDRKRDNGLIYFPISLLILTLCYYNGILKGEDVILGVLAMGYGDGLAAMIGAKYGVYKYKIYKGEKSYEGSVIVLVSIFIIALLVKDASALDALLIAIIGTIIESITPFGFDNITLPIIIAFIGAWIC